MRTISNGFREALRGIRQLDALISWQSDSAYNVITTELGEGLTTELSELLATELGNIIFKGEQIISINPLFNVELFKSVCNSVAIQVKEEIPVDTWLNVKIGVWVNDSYEYLDFGDYYVTESKYEADTQSYSITAYDKMVEAMVPYDLEVTYPITIKNLLIAIFNRLNWEYQLDTFINQNKVLTKDLFSNQDLTLRDVLDDISQVTIGNIYFDKKVAKIKYISHLESSTQIPFAIPETLNIGNASEDRYITDEDLKNINVTLDKKYGPVNSVLITSNNVVLNNLQDSTSIEANGKTEYDFKDNRILINDSDSFIYEMFDAIKGLEFYLYDFDTIGKLCYEPLDEVIIKIGEDEYKTLVLNDDIKLTTGLEETFYVDVPEDTTKDYIAVDRKEKKLNNALISIDKANAEIVLKVDSNGKIAQARLDGDADDGTLFDVKADNIKLEGYTTINNGFSIDLSGNMTCNNATVNGGEITLYGAETIPKITLINPNQTNSYVELSSGILKAYSQGSLASQFYYMIGALSLYSSDGATSAYTSGGVFLKDENGTQTIVLDNYTGNVRCVSLTQTSKEEDKKNFEKYINALDNLKDVDIYKYNYKSESDNHKKHIGFVIGKDYKYSSEITATDENDNEIGVDLYSMTSLCLQAIKEQQEQIEELKQRIETLERNK